MRLVTQSYTEEKSRHCEERSDEATQQVIAGLRLGCFVLLRSPRNDGIKKHSYILPSVQLCVSV